MMTIITFFTDFCESRNTLSSSAGLDTFMDDFFKIDILRMHRVKFLKTFEFGAQRERGIEERVPCFALNLKLNFRVLIRPY